MAPPPVLLRAPATPRGTRGLGTEGAARYDGRHASGGAPALALAPGESPGTPWTETIIAMLERSKLTGLAWVNSEVLVVQGATWQKARTLIYVRIAAGVAN